MHLEIETVIQQWDRFDTIIDVRSPGEWAVDHLPGAINVPVLSDMERDDIGKRYAASAFEAKKKGLRLSPEILPTPLRPNSMQCRGNGGHSFTAGEVAIGVRPWPPSWSELAGDQRSSRVAMLRFDVTSSLH